MNSCSLHKFALILSICCLALIGCADTEDYSAPSIGNATVYLSLQINTGIEGTRALPNGGENGNGTEDGINNENKIDPIANVSPTGSKKKYLSLHQIGRAHV